MPLARFQRLDLDKRAQLLAVAATHFATKGYEVASLDDILDLAGLGKSQPYFADKEDLYITVLEDAMERLALEVPQPDLTALVTETFWPVFEAYSAAMTAVVARTPTLVNLFRPMQGMWHSPTGRFKPIIEKMQAKQRSYIEAGQRLGCVRCDLDADWLISILRAADAVLDERLLNAWEITPEALKTHAQLAFNTLRRLLEPDRAAKG
jgi:AcrR family transcriptional regulator